MIGGDLTLGANTINSLESIAQLHFPYLKFSLESCIQILSEEQNLRSQYTCPCGSISVPRVHYITWGDACTCAHRRIFYTPRYRPVSNPFLGKNRFVSHHIFWRSEFVLGRYHFIPRRTGSTFWKNRPDWRNMSFSCLSFGEMNLSLVNIIMYLGELGPSFRKIGLIGETCPSLAFFL